MWYVYFCGIIFWRIGEKVSNKERIRMERFVLESRIFGRNGKKYNSVGNLFGTLATTVNRVFLQYPERSFLVVIMPTVTLRPVQTLRIILFHPRKNVNNEATFTSEQSFIRVLSRYIKLFYCYMYIRFYRSRWILEFEIIQWDPWTAYNWKGNEKPVALDVSIYFLFQISS